MQFADKMPARSSVTKKVSWCLLCVAQVSFFLLLVRKLGTAESQTDFKQALQGLDSLSPLHCYHLLDLLHPIPYLAYSIWLLIHHQPSLIVLLSLRHGASDMCVCLL